MVFFCSSVLQHTKLHFWVRPSPKKVQIPTRRGSTRKQRVRHRHTDGHTDMEILIVRTSITRNTQCYVKLIGTFHTFSHWYILFLSGGVPPRTPSGKVLGVDVKFYYEIYIQSLKTS